MMKALMMMLMALLCVQTLSSQSHSRESLLALDGPYLGQQPPGLIPELFGPGIVSTKEWGDAGTFSRDMTRFYVLRWRIRSDARETASVTFEQMDQGWHEIENAEINGMPFFSPDGNTMHFGKRFKTRTKDGWTKMQSLGPLFEDIGIMGLTVSNKGTYVLDEVGTDGDGVIRYSRLVDGKREAPTPFGKEINTGTWNAHPFIAPDESYILWDGERDSGYGSSDVYISFRQQDDSWGEAINLGDKVNTAAEEGGPQVTPDGKYLFFNRMVPLATGDSQSQSDLFWVDAKIIETLRPKQTL